MNILLKPHPTMVLLTGLGLCLLGLGMVAGVAATLATHRPASPIAELPLFATASDTGESISMATGPIDEEMEGVFLLDYVTSALSCVVMNSRKPDLVAGIFTTLVAKDLRVEEAKKPAYLMVTGQASFSGKGQGGVQWAKCVVYVCNQNNGDFAGYSLTWSRNKAAQGVLQRGALVPLVKENARAVKNQE